MKNQVEWVHCDRVSRVSNGAFPMMFKLRKPDLFLLCALLGMSYFNAFSSIDIHPIAKNSLAVVPLAVGFCLYFFWQRRKRSPEASSNEFDPTRANPGENDRANVMNHSAQISSR